MPETPIYHITHVDNLPSILAAGGLHCDGCVGKAAQNLVSIAYDHIKERRAGRTVPCGPGGVLADYVPFYFAPRSPMLYTISRGNVPGYAGGQSEVIHLVSSAEKVKEAKLGFVFTEGHAVMGFTEFFDDLADLTRIDWPLMRSKFWNDTDQYPDRKRRRQAEFLVLRFFPWSLITHIGVRNDKMKERVDAYLEDTDMQPHVDKRSGWYYD